MAKQPKKKKKQVGSLSFAIGTVELNGQKFSGIQYERITYDDGSIKEAGLPEGFPPGLSLTQLMNMAAGLFGN